jgi:hypothetical protein
MTEQTQLQETAGRYSNRYRPGQSGNLAGRPSRAHQRARIAAKAAEFAEPFGGLARVNAVERTLLEKAAELALTKPRTHSERVRTGNLLNRILRDVFKRCGPADSGNPKPLRDRLATGIGA